MSGSEDVGRTPVQSSHGAYDAANRFSRELALWTPTESGADADILPAKSLSDARTRDSVRNDAFIASGINTHRDSIVGIRYQLNCNPNLPVLGLDDVWAREFSEEVEAKFEAWADGFYNWPDAARRKTFTELIRQCVGIFVVNGEYLCSVEWLSRDPARFFYTAFQPIEVNRLSDPQDQRPRDNTRGGVHMSSTGRPLGYYIRRADLGYIPRFGNFSGFRNIHKWSYIRATVSRFGPLSLRPQIIHIVDQDRPNQTRGMSQLAAGLKELRMLKRFRDVVLQNAVLNASFAATIESEIPTSHLFEQFGSGNIGESSLNYAKAFLSGVAQYSDSSRNIQLDGVKIPHLFPGTKLNLNSLATPGGVGTNFEQSFLRYLAGALNISYEELSRDYSQTTYSSARAALNQTTVNMRARKTFVADALANRIFRCWFEEAVNANQIASMQSQLVPNMYDPLMMESFCRAGWIGAGRAQIDELKETQAAILRIKMGLSTYETEVARFGQDFRRVFQQRAREKNLMEELGILPPEMTDLAELETTNRDGSDEENNRNRN